MGKASKAGGKTTKGGKTMNPTDAYRKELRKKELTRNKKERKKVREVGILKKDPETLKDQIQKLEAMKADGALDKARKHKKRQLEDTLNLVMKKRKEYEEKMKEKGEAPVMFSHLGPVRRRTTAEEERAKHPILEDSVYYHPTLNPSGAPPPGKPPMFKSSIGPRIPLPEASGSNVASSSMTELDDGTLTMPPLPPPHTPLPSAGSDSGDGFTMPTSLQLPPPPPMPPIPAMTVGAALPPPPPPGPPPKELFAVLPPFAPLPPPPVYHSTQLFHPGSTGSEKLTRLDDSTSRYSVQVPNLPPPPTPAGLTQKMDNNLQDGSSSEPDTRLPVDAKDFIKMAPPPPPVSQQLPAPAVSVGPNLLPDILPPGIPHLPPPPPPPLTEMRPLLPHPGIPGHSIPPGVMLPVLPQPPFGPPPGYMMRPPLPLGPPPIPQDEIIGRPPFVPLKPSYVKSAASTVIKRPLAQHTPELTAMVPASVQVRRESAAPKPKPKSSTILPTYKPEVARPARKLQLTSSSFTQKPPSIDDSYSAFLEDMKALGALDS